MRRFIGLVVALGLVLAAPVAALAAACTVNTQLKLPVTELPTIGSFWLELVSVTTPASGNSCTYSTLLDSYTYVSVDGVGSGAGLGFSPGISFAANSFPLSSSVVTAGLGTIGVSSLTNIAVGQTASGTGIGSSVIVTGTQASTTLNGITCPCVSVSNGASITTSATETVTFTGSGGVATVFHSTNNAVTVNILAYGNGRN